MLPLLAVSTGSPPPARPTAVDSGRVAIDGGTLYYERAGHGDAVVLLHPAYLDRRVWDPLFEPLAKNFLVIRYDARGYGRSSPATAPFSHAEDLYRLVQAFKLPKVTLVGNSLGGATALDFAVTHPDLVTRLILFAPGLSGYPWPPDDLQESWRVAARQALTNGDTVGVARAWLLSTYLSRARESAPIAAKLDTLLTDNAGWWKRRLRDGHDWDTEPNPPAIRRLELIKQQVILVLGTRDDPEMRRVIDTIQAHLPKARLVPLPDVGHVPSLEAPGAAAGIIYGSGAPQY